MLRAVPVQFPERVAVDITPNANVDWADAAPAGRRHVAAVLVVAFSVIGWVAYISGGSSSGPPRRSGWPHPSGLIAALLIRAHAE